MWGKNKIAFSTLLVSKKVKIEVGTLKEKKFLRALVCKNGTIVSQFLSPQDELCKNVLPQFVIKFVAAVSFKNFHTQNHGNRQKNSEFREISKINPPS
jgi:hypothetical protein